LHDVGLTFGQANFFNRTSVGSVNFEQWTRAPIWKDAAACVGNLSKSLTGTLDNPKVSEAGRQFLADLLVQITDDQLRDLFEVARVDHRSRRPDSKDPPATIDEWLAAFKHKRDEIVNNRCQSPRLEELLSAHQVNHDGDVGEQHEDTDRVRLANNLVDLNRHE
jgi:hypothetical protein